MQYRINKADFFSHYLKIFILLKFYVYFLQKLGKLEKVFNSYQKVERQKFANMDSDITFSVGDNISQRFEYDPLGNITKSIDGEGVLTTSGYDNPFGEVNVFTRGASESEDGQPRINLITTFDYDKRTKNGTGKGEKIPLLYINEVLMFRIIIYSSFENKKTPESD